MKDSHSGKKIVDLGKKKNCYYTDRERKIVLWLSGRGVERIQSLFDAKGGLEVF